MTALFFTMLTTFSLEEGNCFLVDRKLRYHCRSEDVTNIGADHFMLLLHTEEFLESIHCPKQEKSWFLRSTGMDETD